MKNSERTLLSVVLPAIPLLQNTDSFHTAFRIGGVVVLTFWLTVFFFKISRLLFPQKLLGISILLWVAAGTEALMTYTGWGFSPFCALSLLLLLFPHFIKDLRFTATDSWLGVSGPVVQRGLAFLILLIYLGFSREIFRKAGVYFFDQPAGSLFLIALAGWLWQNQPGLSAGVFGLGKKEATA